MGSSRSPVASSRLVMTLGGPTWQAVGGRGCRVKQVGRMKVGWAGAQTPRDGEAVRACKQYVTAQQSTAHEQCAGTWAHLKLITLTPHILHQNAQVERAGRSGWGRAGVGGNGAVGGLGRYATVENKSCNELKRRRQPPPPPMRPCRRRRSAAAPRPNRPSRPLRSLRPARHEGPCARRPPFCPGGGGPERGPARPPHAPRPGAPGRPAGAARAPERMHIAHFLPLAAPCPLTRGQTPRTTQRPRPARHAAPGCAPAPAPAGPAGKEGAGTSQHLPRSKGPPRAGCSGLPRCLALRLRLVTNLPSWPAKGEVLTEKVMRTVGSST